MEKFFVLFLFSLFSSFAKAKNGYFASDYIQYMTGRFCADVSVGNLRCIGWKQNTPDIIKGIALGNDAIFDSIIYQESAKLQRSKNTCLIDRLKVLKNNQSSQDGWYTRLVKGWLEMRKAELMIKLCDDFNNKNRQYQSQRQMRAANGKPMAENTSLKHAMLVNACTENNVMSLKAVKQIVLYSTPVISSPDFYRTIGNHRDDIINTQTGKPITDEEILQTNLSGSLDFILPYLNESKGKKGYKMHADLMGNINRIISERADQNNQLKSVGTFGISQQMKDKMFEDGTIYETLIEKKVLNPNYLLQGGFNRISTVDNNGAACLLSKYEPTIVGELIDFGVTSFLAGGVVLKVARGQEFIRAVGSLEKARKTLSTGMLAVGLPGLATGIFNTCFTTNQTSTTSVRNTEQLAQVALPEEYGSTIADSRLDENFAKIPSCKRDSDVDLIAGSFSRYACYKTVVYSLLPMKLSIPAGIVDSAFSNY